MSKESGVGSAVNGRRRFSILGVALVVGGIAALAGGAWFVSDPHGNRDAKHRLAPALTALDRVDPLPHAEPRSPAKFHGCGTDSGELFEPQVRRAWTLDLPTDATAVVRGMSRSLMAQGWARSSDHEGQTQVGAQATLRLRSGRDLIEMHLMQYGRRVEVEAAVSNHKLCRDLGFFNLIL